MVGPGNGYTGGEEDSCIKQGDRKGVNGGDPCRGSVASNFRDWGEAAVEEGSKKPKEEHGFRGDK